MIQKLKSLLNNLFRRTYPISESSGVVNYKGNIIVFTPKHVVKLRRRDVDWIKKYDKN